MEILREITLGRYKQNCSIATTNDGDYVKSYDTLVAKIDYATETVIALGWWSMTTSKHINYVAKELGYFDVQTSFK